MTQGQTTATATESQPVGAIDSRSSVETAPGLPVPLVLDFSSVDFSDDRLVRFCADNDNLRIELTADKELIVMPPTNAASGSENYALSGELYIWSKQDGTGVGFDSSAGFTFPNGAMRSPDCSWVLRDRWDAVPDDDKRRFPHLAPDFVAELLSSSDALPTLQAKMVEYIQNGVRLGWLIDPFQRQVHVYLQGQSVEILDDPETVSGDPVLPGFVLNLLEIW